MKKTLTILFAFTCFFASAQKLDSIRGAGYFWERMMAVKSLGIPTFCGIPKTNYTDSTKKAQIGYDSCAGKFYTYNPATETWSEPGGGGVSGVDSVTIVQTGCAFTFYTWQAGVSTAVGTLSQYNGLTPGTGLVTHTSGLTFTVTAAVYAIDCVTYVTRDTTITLPAAGDTGRIDVIKVNTSGVTTQGTGTEGIALPLPSLTADELALSYILVTDTGVVSAPPAETPTWDYVATNLTTHNPVSNVGIGGAPAGFKLQVFGTSALGVGNVNHFTRFGPGLQIDYDGIGPRLFSAQRIGINGQAGLNIVGLGSSVSDTGAYKLMSIDNSGNVKRFSFWPVGAGGGGGSQNLSSVLTEGNTASNFVQIDSLKLYDSPNDGYGSISLNDFVYIFRDKYTNSVATLNNQSASISLYKANGLSWQISDEGDSLTASRNYQVPNKSGTIALLSDITTSTSDTIFVDAPLESYTSGDSNKIRINPDTLAAWRPKYMVYKARISQTGTSAPTEDYVYENTIGSLAWEYTTVGKYSLKALSPVFDANKTTTIQTVSVPTDALGTIYYTHGEYIGDTEFELEVGDGAGNLVDGKLTSYTIEIRVYY